MLPTELYPQPQAGMLSEQMNLCLITALITIKSIKKTATIINVFLLTLVDPVKFLSVYLLFAVAMALGLYNILLWDGDWTNVAQQSLQVVNWPS